MLTVTLAACTVRLVDTTSRVQLFPRGAFSALDGRPHEAPHWIMDEAAVTSVLTRFAARKNPLPIDFEHQTLLTMTNGQPAPAAGWMQRIEVDEAGVYATVTWTKQARDWIDAGQYLYLSPVFSYDPASGRVLELLHAALTNVPALDGMQPLADVLQAAARLYRLPISPSEDPTMSSDLTEMLGLPDDATAEVVLTAVAALKAQVSTAPDPAQYLPVAVVDALRTELGAATAKLTELATAQQSADKLALIEAGLADGRLLPPMRAWAEQQDIAVLGSYLASATPIAALTRQQSSGKPPPVRNFADDPTLVAEFGTEERYLAYQRANKAGLVNLRRVS